MHRTPRQKKRTARKPSRRHESAARGEAARLAALRRLKVLDTPPEEAFDGIVRIAARICGVPIALLGLIDNSRQWFKARVGLDLTELPREVSLCAYAIRKPNAIMIVPDATRDRRFRSNPLVTDTRGIRFCAAAPLVTRAGAAIGTLCVIDRKPRELAPEQTDALQELARQAVTEMELRASRDEFATRYRQALITAASEAGPQLGEERLRHALAESEARWRAWAELSADAYWEIDRDYRITHFSYGPGFRPEQPAESRLGKRLWEFPGSLIDEAAWRALGAARKSFRDLPAGRIDTGAGVRYFQVSGEPRFDANGAFLGYRGVTRDVTERITAARQEHDSDERLRAAVENLDESIVLTDEKDRIVLANRRFRSNNAHVAEYIAPGRNYADHLRQRLALGDYPDAAGREAAWLEERLANRHRPAGPIERQRADGSWLRFTDQRLPDGGVVTYGLDITERKRIEQALVERERELRLIMDGMPVMITRIDRAGRFRFVNRAYAELMERGVADLVGRTVQEVLSPDAYAHIKPSIDCALAGEPVSVARSQLRADGQIIELEGRYIPDRDDHGDLVGMFALHRDVTAERQARKNLAESEARFRSLTALSSDWYWEQDEHFRFTFMSGDLNRHTGIVSREHYGRTRWEMPALNLSEEDWARHRALLERHEPFRDFEMRRPDQGDRRHWVSISGEPVFDAEGRFRGYRGVGRDITPRKLAEEALRDREQMLAALLRNMPGDVYRCRNDRDWTMEYVSEGVLELTGYPPSAFTSERRVTYGSLVHPDDRDRIWREAQAALAERRPYMIEYRIHDAHGTEKWVWERGSGDYAEDGSVLALDGFVADITARKRAEEALREQSERLQIGQAAARMIILDRDITNDRLTWSDSPEWLRGPLPASGQYPLFKDQVHPDDRERFLAMRARAIDTLQGQTQEFRVVRTDGAVVWVLARQKVFANASGKAARMLVALFDITDRRRAENALAESEARFRAVFERSSAGMAISDTNGSYLSVNAAFARFFGYSADEIVGKLKVSDLRAADDSEGAALYQRLVAGEIGYYERERPYRRKDGSQIWARVTASAVRDTSGKALYLVAVFSDITEEVLARARIERMNSELEERVRERTAELRDAVKELDAFTYSVSHDLRAPVGAVSGFAHLLRTKERDRLSEDGKHLLGVIEQNAERMINLIEGLLRFSRLGSSELRRVRLSMNELAGEALLDCAAAARAEVHAGPLPDCDGDRTLLAQVWANLIGNAFKYSRGRDPARVEIGWDAAREAYFVRDNGVGFDMAYATKLFGVFERLHHESEFEGSGIGLAIAERILKRHGGAIWVDAAADRGATFWFTVPGTAGAGSADLRSSAESGR